MFQLEPI